MGVIGLVGLFFAGVVALVIFCICCNNLKSEDEIDAMTKEILRAHSRITVLEREVIWLRVELNQLKTNGQATKNAPPRPVPPKKYVSENDSFDIPTVAATATAAALGATALGAWAMPSSSSSSYSSDSSWDCGDSFDCGGD